MKLKLETKEGVIVQDATVYSPIYCVTCWAVVYVSVSDDERDAEHCARALDRHYGWHEAQVKATLADQRRIDRLTMALITIGTIAVLHAWISFMAGLPR